MEHNTKTNMISQVPHMFFSIPAGVSFIKYNHSHTALKLVQLWWLAIYQNPVTGCQPVNFFPSYVHFFAKPKPIRVISLISWFQFILLNPRVPQLGASFSAKFFIVL